MRDFYLRSLYLRLCVRAVGSKPFATTRSRQLEFHLVASLTARSRRGPASAATAVDSSAALTGDLL